MKLTSHAGSPLKGRVLNAKRGGQAGSMFMRHKGQPNLLSKMTVQSLNRNKPSPSKGSL